MLRQRLCGKPFLSTTSRLAGGNGFSNAGKRCSSLSSIRRAALLPKPTMWYSRRCRPAAIPLRISSSAHGNAAQQAANFTPVRITNNKSGDV